MNCGGLLHHGDSWFSRLSGDSGLFVQIAYSVLINNTHQVVDDIGIDCVINFNNYNYILLIMFKYLFHYYIYLYDYNQNSACLTLPFLLYKINLLLLFLHWYYFPFQRKSRLLRRTLLLQFGGVLWPVPLFLYWWGVP